MMAEFAEDSLPLLDLDATAQAALVRDGQLTPSALLEAAIARVTRLNPALNAVAAADEEKARDRAWSVGRHEPFAGVPTLLKDLLRYPGLPCAYGSRLFQGFVPDQGSPYTRALDAAGLVALGKTTTSEFGLLGTTEGAASRATRNPWNTDCSTGGSSGGAVAAVASGMVPVAHASDGGGSIRGPAALCGLFGFKPSRGRTVQADLAPETPLSGIVSDHCVSRSVRDSATWLRITETGEDPLPSDEDLAAPPPQLRIGVHVTDCFGNAPDPEVAEAFERTVGLCAALGHRIARIDMPVVDAGASVEPVLDLMAASMAGVVGQVSAMIGADPPREALEPYTWALVERGRLLDGSRVAGARQSLAALGALAAGALEDVDVLLSPTIPFTAPPLGRFGPEAPLDRLKAQFQRCAAYTAPASLGGLPAMSVPLFPAASGMPVGSHFVGRPGGDALLFRLAFQLEGAAPWAPRLLHRARELAAWSKS